MSQEAPRFVTDRPEEVRQARPWSPFAYVSVKLRRLIADLLANATPSAGGTVLDYGCADAPYAGLLPAGVTYVGADLPGNPDAEVILRPDGSLPLPDASVDVVMSTQVLEHVGDPARYLSECARVLRPGGSLVLSTHGLMYLHRDPEDLWRWTVDGLARMVTDAGLEVAEQRGVLGLVASGLQLILAGTGGRLPRLLQVPYVMVFQGLIGLADKLGTEAGRRENALVIAVRAVRPVSPA